MADKEIFGNAGPVDPKLKRATFDKSFVNNLTAKVGVAIPVLVEECPPDSAYSIDTNFAFDFHPMWYPIQNNVTAHLSFWRVPFRILWKHYKRFNDQIGSDGKINGTNEYTMPYIKKASGWCKQGSLADYLGLPTNYYQKYDKWTGYEILRYGKISQGTYGAFGGDVLDSVVGYDLRYGILCGHDGMIADDGKVRLVFHTNDTSNTAATYQAAITAASIEFSACVGRKISNNGGIHQSECIPLAVSSFECKDGDVLTINGQTIKQIIIELTVAVTPEYKQFIDGKTNLGLCIVYKDSAGLALTNILLPQGATSLFPQVITIDNDKQEPPTYDELRPPVTNYGLSKHMQIHESLPTSGSKTYFDSVEGADPVIPINALPFRAYEFIRNYYFRNSRVDPFKKVDPDSGVLQECYDEYITNDGDGADSTTPTELFKVPWEYDMFTTAVPRPIYGNAPLVGLSVNKDGNGDYTTATFEMVDSVTSEPYTFNVKCNPKTGGIIAIDNVGDGANSANTPVFDALNYAISCGISISDFRNADALTRFSEKRMRAGNKHIDIVKEFFGVVPPLGEEYPTYLGGVSRRIMVNKIMNVAQSEGNPLGDFAGSAVVNGKSKRIRTFCKERCYIIGLLWFSVTPLYSQQLPKHFIKSKLLDYYNPLFANISAQPIYCKEIAPLQLSSEEVDDVFGYGRPWADYVSRRDEVHGDFRGNMADFLFQRIFYNRPRLNSSFIDMNSADLTNVFSNTDDNDKIFGQVAFGIRAKLPIPRYSNPQII